ncbi:hypothetical protein V8E51_017599 [Hyaloscypha variabilis]
MEASKRVEPTIPYALREVFELVETYTTRRATLQSDTLRAIDSLLTRASKLDRGMVTTYHYGLPVAAFDYALCWLEDEHAPERRRRDFPSWSWAGWMSTVKFPMGKPSYSVAGGGNTAMSLFTNAVLNSEAKTFDLNISGTVDDGLKHLHNSEGAVEENRRFEDLRDFYGICVSPKALVHANYHFGRQDSTVRVNNDPSLVFYTSYAKLRVDGLPIERDVISVAKTPPCGVYALRSPENSKAQLGSIRLNREWRESQPEFLDLDFIVIRATPSEEFEPYWHSSMSQDPPSSPAPADWKVFLMCIVWIDGDALEGKPRKAERITMTMVQEKRGRTRRRESKNDDREITHFLPSARDWMSVEPKPVEVLVELI